MNAAGRRLRYAFSVDRPEPAVEEDDIGGEVSADEPEKRFPPVSHSTPLHPLSSITALAAIIARIVPPFLPQEAGASVAPHGVQRRGFLDRRNSKLTHRSFSHNRGRVWWHTMFDRSRALVRRSSRHRSAGRTRLSIGHVTIDKLRHEVHIGRQRVSLTRTECALLWQLALQPGRVFRREELLTHVWTGVTVEPRTVDTHVSKVRRKLHGRPEGPILIETIWGFGYRFKTAAEIDETSGQRRP